MKRVLFAHGLESGPLGTKVAALRSAGLEVTAPTLPCSAERRAVEPELMLQESLEVLKSALSSDDYDVVVGSSFGGALVTELLRSGDWTGPTLLLCPGWKLFPSGDLADLAPAGKVVIVHGDQDTVVPLEHSQELAEAIGATLITVQDDHRLSATATPLNLTAWIKTSLIERELGGP